MQKTTSGADGMVGIGDDGFEIKNREREKKGTHSRTKVRKLMTGEYKKKEKGKSPSARADQVNRERKGRAKIRPVAAGEREI